MPSIIEIAARHEVSAPFQGDPIGSKAQFNQAREDRGTLLAELARWRAVGDAAEKLLSDYEQFDEEQAALALALYDAGREVFGCYETCQCDPKPVDCDECAPREAVLKAMRAKVARGVPQQQS